MKSLKNLIWLTQLGLSVAFPLAGFVLLGVWLRQVFDLGIWVVIVFTALGAVIAVQSFRSTLKTMERMAKDQKEEEPPAAYNEHD